MSTAPRTLCEAFQTTAAAYPDTVALRTADNSVCVTWRQYAARVRTIAAGLAALGVEPGDTVALMLTNRPEFHLIDTAVLHIGAIPFSIYNSNPADKISYLFRNAGNKVVICERQFAATLQATEGTIDHLICIDGNPDGTATLAEIEAGGDAGFDFETAWKSVDPTAPVTIIYTSGTTGPPKGVELTHANVLSDHRAVEHMVGFGPTDSIISYLPDAHAANRMLCHYSGIIYGNQIVTVDDLKAMPDALRAVRPTGFLGVPNVWYKFKTAIETAIAAQNPFRRTLANWAVTTGRRVARLRSQRRAIRLDLRMRHALAERLVLGALRKRIGLDRVRLAASGAAPISPDALEFILGLGLVVSEAWGMSELTSVATFNPPDAIRIGSIGKIVPTCEIRIAEDGELLVRGPMVMRGYHNDPEKTAETIDADGWLRTGDIGTLDADGYYYIVDRKKELMINAAGKNMSPSNIEGAVRAACPLIGNVVAIGDNRKYVTALLTLDPDAVATYATVHRLADTSHAAVAAHPPLRTLLEAGIATANARLSRVEQIKKFTVLPDIWEPGGDLVTPTQKLKRKPITERYASEIDALYR